MPKLTDIVALLDRELSIHSYTDAPCAHNGLQVQNDGKITHVALAVDATLATIQSAIACKADLLLVHHGLFWAPALPITGISYSKIKALLSHNLAVYSAHLPLDCHPELGNNALLARALNLTSTGEPGYDYHGVSLGTMCTSQETCKQLMNRLKKAVENDGTSEVRGYFPHGKEAPAGRVFVCSGGAGDDLPKAAALHANTFVTGEGSHWNIPLAHELGINLIYGGHYATETFGVIALGALLRQEFGIKATFLHVPPDAYA